MPLNPIVIKKGAGLVESLPNPFYPHTIYLCGTLEATDDIEDLNTIDLLTLGEHNYTIDLGTLEEEP